ncbi:MAG: hypothetical protein J7500_01540 [Sphingomonas sp.]|uniref:hypothetical protein n=1 Tax=Sphingomonas sp. TaxID=28214 RepID=UPI001B213BCB|nr:hypothetical protein [Sphingomonas sp.]MBO9621372.1 hypothetical protein [Sphingomonas sp.]
MNAQTGTTSEIAAGITAEIVTDYPPFDPATFDHAAYHGFRPAPGATRHEGWIPARQRIFLEALSEGRTVSQACAIVGLSKQSAYALRHSARGAGFALGWDAAVLVSRAALADELMERAFQGTHDSTTDDNGRIVTRHRQDNRLALAMLNRLDRMADGAKAPGTAAAARLVATDFAQYLDLVGRDAGPARAGVFLGARVEPAGEDDLAPIRALARADRWLRTHSDIAEPLDTSDLDPAAREHWSSEQWLRAEAAGLVALAPAETRESSQAESTAGGGASLEPGHAGNPVWWDPQDKDWRTRFAPPEGFAGSEDGAYGDDDYSRTLTAAEHALIETICEQDTAALHRAGAEERDAWFAARAREAAGGGGGSGEAEPAGACDPPAPAP